MIGSMLRLQRFVVIDSPSMPIVNILAGKLKQSSWMETGNNDIYTFDPTIGFGDETLLCVDQRGIRFLFCLLEESTWLTSRYTCRVCHAHSKRGSYILETRSNTVERYCELDYLY